MREAASLSPDFATLLETYAASNREAQVAQIVALLKAWSDTSTMATTATGAYAGHTLTIGFQDVASGSPEYQAWLDKLTALERFNGRTFRPVPEGDVPVNLNFSIGQMVLLDRSYAVLKSWLYGALLMQAHLNRWLTTTI